MTLLYGNLADAALGDLRFAQNFQERVKSAALKPATRVVIGLVLTIIGLAALAILGEAPDRFTGAMPAMADLEHWLIWGDLKSF
jgi:hypothetical protein